MKYTPRLSLRQSLLSICFLIPGNGSFCPRCYQPLPPRLPRLSHVHHLPRHTLVVRTSSQQEHDQWEAGDVYQDLFLLEQAINASRAEENLAHLQRLETLNYMASTRRPLKDDLRRYILLPLTVSFLMACLCKMSIVAKCLSTASRLQFWTMVVGAPILALAVHHKRKQSSESPSSLPDNLKDMDPVYYRFLSTSYWEDTKTSCRDVVTCLLEQVVSAVAGLLVSLPLLLLLGGGQRQDHTRNLVIRLITRLGAFVALHQFPKLWFQLVQDGPEVRPMTWSTWATRGIARLQWMPWSMAVDLALLLSSMLSKWTRIGLVYATLASMVATVYVKPALFATNKQQRQSVSLPSWKLLVVPVGMYVIHGLYSRLFAAFTTVSSILRSGDVRFILRCIPFTKLLRASCLVVALAGPIAHIACIRRILTISKTHNLSLGRDIEQIRELYRNADAIESRTIWRWSLKWHTPKRVATVLRDWDKAFWYWLFFSGSVQDKLLKESIERYKEETRKQEMSIWKRLAEQPYTTPDRSEWKALIMEKLARKHQLDYERKTFDDPLGIAVQQTFGVGLGFAFDHMSDLKPGEKPSTRRLQARAAKSAVKRAQEIFDASTARNILDNIKDPQERDRVAAEMRRKSDEEIQYLAKKLSELIPTDTSPQGQEETMRFEQFSTNEYERVSPNRYVLRRKLDVSSALQTLMNEYSTETNHDDEFIEEWSKWRRYGNLTETGEDGVDMAFV